MMVKLFHKFKNISPTKFPLAILSGLLIGTSYIPFPPWALIFCYVPLWIHLVTRSRGWKDAFVAGWWTQFLLSLIGFHWVSYVTKEFSGFPWPMALVALLAFAAFVHLYIPLSAALVVFLKERFQWSAPKTLLAAALTLTLAERLWPAIFPWHLGYPLLWAHLPAAQWADVIGFEGLSTVVLLVNAWIAWAWMNRHQPRICLKHLVLVVIFLAAVNIGGAFHQEPWNRFDRKFKVSLIQANVGNLEKVMAEQGRAFQDVIVKKFMALSTQAVQQNPDTEMLVWPETAFPDYLDDFNKYSRIPILLQQLMTPLGKTLLTGSYAKDGPEHAAPRMTYNALFLVDPAGHSMGQPYRKTMLLAFGEYLPFSESFPILLQWMPFIANFGRGEGPTVLEYPRPDGAVRIGAQICYEGLYPEFTRGLAEKGADVLANVTNDSWFGRPFEPRQHLYMTLARALEVRRPLIRATNTGISTVILANGDVLQQSPLHEEWQGSYEVLMKKDAPTTAYVRWGHFDWILIWLALILLLLKGVRDARPHRP